MAITSSQAQNITSPNGNSLAVFVDGVTGILLLKDINGKTEPLSNYVCGGGGGNTSPFEYNANATGIQPILGTNDASGCYSSIGGGQSNTASDCRSTIGGGSHNISSCYASTIGGGNCNNALGFISTVGGGRCNIASGYYATIGGGKYNTASCYSVTVGGGRENTASGNYTTIGGGCCNTAHYSIFSTIGGGQQNTASCDGATIGGGKCNTASGYCSIVGGGYCNIASSTTSIVGSGVGNIASGNKSSILGGVYNTASCNYATIVGGICNTASKVSTTIGGGSQNTASCDFATIGGGRCNTALGCYSGILAGKFNHTCGFANAMIVGSNLCATQSCTTFTNCLSANNLTVGCAVSVGTNKVLVNSSFTNTGGLFAQTGNSTPITATTVEGTLIDGGVGTLTVPANGFGVGDSFTGNMSGIMSAQNNDTITIRVKSGSVILAQSDPLVLPAITNQVWNLILGFTIRTLGGVGVASISTFGEMHILKLASGTQEGFGFSEINNTTFDTTILNTLSVTAQWSSNNASNSIYTQLFVLTKIF